MRVLVFRGVVEIYVICDILGVSWSVGYKVCNMYVGVKGGEMVNACET